MSTLPLTVLAVVNDYPAQSETFIMRKLNGLSASGVKVQVAASEFGPDAYLQELPLVPLLPWRSMRATAAMVRRGTGRHLLRSWTTRSERDGTSVASLRRSALAAPLVAAAAEVDVVHFEFSGIAVSYLDILERLRPAKIVVSCRGSAEQIRTLGDDERLGALREVFDRVDLIHCVSEDLRATAEGLGAPSEKVVVNRPAVPVADFARLRERREPHAGPLRVLSIGRLHWYKGFDDGVRAMAKLQARGQAIDYRIAGDGPLYEKLTFLRHQLDVDGCVTFLGAQTQDQIRAQLLWADVLLLPSLSEGISNAVLEAMASGLPVVSTDCGGMTEVITSDEDGIIVPIGDTEAMAHHLALLASDPDRRDRLGTRAAGRAAAEFDLQRQIRLFKEAYDNLLTPEL